MPRLILRAVTVTDVGPARPNNEDAAFAGRRLVVIADGVGGMPAGEMASEIVIETLRALEEAETTDPAGALVTAVEEANARIAAEGQGAGTTVTAGLLHDDQLGLLHVGDSRGYLLAAGATDMVRLTRDDTFVQLLVDRGALTAEEARAHPRRSVITQAVQGETYRPATALLPLEPGDRLLLCSDGLSDYVEDATIGKTLREIRDPRACAEELVALALAAGTFDNVTVVVADAVVAG
ncbi:protein phosphatase 2C domain-containing protein [Asanoa sp. WMMD1127]|uniref:PP2C family protein-serine/threonine phosphatase n=1 Tax=Asanoa sp. WMMD1127 TaxID=3016107 RepID=UPI002416CF5C|nr:protein phosphatase 2C domain-containing protein [Asanoa sp. WMMD1127]MDG4821561.1 protein phosphatase 2C domain-containing protein [Asanoa sp. WMMD1127]